MTRLGVFFALAVTLWCATAEADPERFALVIGANRGLADEAQLHFAEQDAARVAKVLVQLAGVPEENLLLALGSPPSRVKALAQELGVRLGRLRAGQPTAKPLVFVYYSGHSSAGALHLGALELPFAELRELIATAGPDAAIYVIDSCRSGGMTRAKGGQHAPAFAIQNDARPQAKGTAILASSADDEDAQESDRLGGGIFTTHFIGGLRGAADADADRRVTLGEIYAYAYRETLLTTSRTRTLQHPTYSFQLSGGQDVTVSRIDRNLGQATLKFVDAGRYVLLDRGGAETVAGEFQIERPTELVLPPGRYTVRQVGARVVYEGKLDVAEGDQADVSVAGMRALPYGHAVRRGLTQESVVSLQLDVGAAMPPLTNWNAGVQAAAGAAVDMTGARLQGRLRYGWSTSGNRDVAMTQQTIGGDVTASHIFDVPSLRAGLGVGVRVGLDRFLQDFDTRGVAPDRGMWAWRAAPVVRMEFAPAARWLAGVECGVDVHVLRVSTGETQGWQAPVAPFCTVSGGLYVP